MRIAILGNWNYERLTACMEKLITDSQCYLFAVVCGGTCRESAHQGIGYKWATAHGAPVEYVFAETADKVIDKLVSKIDYVVAFDDGNPLIKKVIMKMNMEGKHGTVEKILR